MSALPVLVARLNRLAGRAGSVSAGERQKLHAALESVQAEPDYWSNSDKQSAVAQGYRRLYASQAGQ